MLRTYRHHALRTFYGVIHDLLAEGEVEIYLVTRKRYVRRSDGFIDRQQVIFAGFLEAGRLIKEPGVLRYVTFMKINSSVASRGMKTYSEGRIELRNLQFFKRLLEKSSQFLSLDQPHEPKSLDVP